MSAPGAHSESWPLLRAGSRVVRGWFAVTLVLLRLQVFGNGMNSHLVVQACPRSRDQTKRRRRTGQERPFEGRTRPLRAGIPVSLWPPWRRCFCVRQDDRDALLIAPKFIGVVEAGGALMESIMVRAAASRRHLLQRLGSRSWWTLRARSSPPFWSPQ